MCRARRVLILVLTVAFLSAGLAPAQAAQAPQVPKPDSELLVRLKALPGVVEAKEARFDGAIFKESYELTAVYYYSDQGKKAFEPFQYQAFTEIGYYNYDLTDFKPHMKTLKDPTNLVLCPEGIPIVYDPRPMAEVYHFLQYHGDRIIYIYGELDPWSSTGIQLIGRTDAFKIVVKNGYHGSRVRDFSPEQKELFYATLERWLGLTLPREVPK